MVDDAACEAVLMRFQRGELSAPVALMHLLIATEDAAHVERLVRDSAAALPQAMQIVELMDRNSEGCERVAAMLRSDVDSPPRGATVAEGIAFCRQLFDWSVQQSEEASVALYSLGSPELLAAGTAEIVDLLESWGSLGRDKRALDIGCGIGRLESALSPRLKEIHGIDVSDKMVAVARRRCAGLSNATFSSCSGFDFAGLEDRHYDLVLAVDSFPYLVQSGIALVDAHFGEVARVLAPAGDLVILNFSYRDDPVLDRLEVTELARTHGFGVRTNGTSPFTLWDAMAFHLTRPPAPQAAEPQGAPSARR